MPMPRMPAPASTWHEKQSNSLGVPTNPYFVANNYVEALKEMAKSPNQKMLLLPIEATGILGSLAGIAELAKESLGQQQKAAAIQPPLR